VKSETDIPSLSDIGKRPRTEIGAHSVIRHAYENVLTACARLGSFATGWAGNPSTSPRRG
jgi:hypothetical protein